MEDNLMLNQHSSLLLCPNCGNQIPFINPTITEKNKIRFLIKCSCINRVMKWKLKHYLNKVANLSKTSVHKCSKLRHYKKGEKYCALCQLWLCEDCLYNHNQSNPNHLLMDIELYLSCNQHKTSYSSYCKTCYLSICNLCDNEHQSHDKIEINDISLQYFENDYININSNILYNEQLNHIFNQLKENDVNVNGNGNGEYLIQWKKELSKCYRRNKKINTRLKQFFDILLFTAKAIMPYKSYSLAQTINTCKINQKETIIFQEDNIEEMYLKLKTHFKSNYILELTHDYNKNEKLDLVQFKAADKLPPKCIATLTGHNFCITTIIQLSDGRLASGGYDATIKLWNISTFKCEVSIRAHNYLITSLIQLQNSHLASCGYDCTIKLWDINTNCCIVTLRGHKSNVYSLIQLLDGRLVSGSKNDFIVWDANNFTQIKTIQGHVSCINSIIQLQNLRIASGGSDTMIKIWDTTRFDCVAMLKSTFCINKLIQLLNGKLVSCQGRQIKVWDTDICQCLLTITEYDNSVINSVTQLDDGRLVVGFFDSRIVIYDSTLGKPIITLKEDYMSVNTIIQLNDYRLASCSGNYIFGGIDASIKIWSNL